MKIKIFLYYSIVTIFFICSAVCFAEGIKEKVCPYTDTPKINKYLIDVTMREASLKKKAKISSCCNCDYFWIDFVNSYGETTEPERFLKTYNNKKILFANIESMKVTGVSTDSIQMEVKVFPDISPEELLSLEPSYQGLAGRYTAVKNIEIPVRKFGIYEMQFNCATSNDDLTSLRFYELPFGTSIDLSFDLESDHPPIWWAIKSVVNDEKYPYSRETQTNAILQAPSAMSVEVE